MFTIELRTTEWGSLDVDGRACFLLYNLERLFGKENLKVYVQDAVFCVDSSCLKFRTFNDNFSDYEWSLEDAEKKRVSLSVDNDTCDPDLVAYLDEDSKLDIVKLINDKAAKGERKLFSLMEKIQSEKYGDYEDSYCMTYDASEQKIKLDFVSTKQEPYEEGISGSFFNRGITSWIKYFTIDERISFDFCNDSFQKIMKKIAAYCEQEQLEFSVYYEEYGICGHDIDVPCVVVETSRFKMVFNPGDNVKEVHVSEEIMDASSYMESQGEVHIIGNIIRQVKSQKKEFCFISGFGAENIWHHSYPDGSKYIYGCGFNL